MKNIILVSIVFFTLLSCNTESQKIGFVNNTDLISDYQEKMDIEAKFKGKIETFQKRTDSIGQAFQAEAQAFQLKAQGMAQDKAQLEYQALGQKQQMLQQRIQQEEGAIQEESQEAIDSLIKKVRDYVKVYGKKNGYTYILGSNEAGSVMYGEESKDLTKEILESLNADYNKAE
ncbi:OmpH family outer membrane protein [Bizionia myxarmorum]|uniref:OmpH family outer membrane protein n=1 Tax=Bizionia myxarmorum TaxID=291186 RepID=A0A5D0RDW4_9FLAO|nr:OmpH family outer membrane protein [Bizionia myxarmorum]TYB78734.1 OmpH family outer membrane protein [Bizionia myxarmorum]